MLKEYQEELEQEVELTTSWRASMVGNPCETFLCHMKLNDDYKPPRGRVKHMLEDGKMHEEDVIRRCITAGYQVLHSCLDKQLELKIPINKNTVISGHPDGILVCNNMSFDLDRWDSGFKFGKSSYLLEITAPSSTNFARLVKGGLKDQNYQKYIQTQLYMKDNIVKERIQDSGCVLVAKNKNTTALYEEGISYHQSDIDELEQRLDRVNEFIRKGILPDFRCDDVRKVWCRYHELCFDKADFAPVELKGMLDGRTMKEVTRLLGIVAMWERGKDLEGQSKELIEEAREEFREIIEDYDAEGIIIDDVKAKMIDSHSTKCDYATLKRKAPDLYDEVVIITPTRYVRVSK